MIDLIIEDVQRRPIIILSDRGHGKSTSLMTIIQELKKKHPKIIVKVFDISQAWYHKAPVKYRQRITFEKLMSVNFLNLDDCVYEIGSLSKELRRMFVSLIIKQDYQVRYEMGIKYGIKSVGQLPIILYLFEEANCYFGSYSLRKNDEFSEILNDFVSVGRNYGLNAFMVVTAETGELSPSLRRRSTRLIGQVSNDYDMRALNRKSKGLGNKALDMPRFHWIYYNGQVSEPFRILDLVENVPKDFEVKRDSPKQVEVTESKGMSTLSYIVLTAIAVFLLTVILLRL